MCGICGVRRFGDVPIPEEMVTLLILNQQNRGLEAAGVALQDSKGNIEVLKNNVTPYQFVSSHEYKDFVKEHLTEDTMIVIGHARKATIGPPRIISNNHPMYCGTTAVVHNGHISNHDEMFKAWRLDRKAETDSDIFRAVFDEEGFSKKAISMLSKLSGSGAFAAISKDYPGKLMLGRSGNPIEVVVTANQHFIFSSETGPLYKILRPYKNVHGLMMREMTPKDYYMIALEDDSAYLLTDKRNKNNDMESNWFEWHHDLHIANGWRPHTYTCHADFYNGRQRFYGDEHPIDVVKCPNPACSRWISVPPSSLADLKRYTCKCGTKLG